MIKPEQLCFVPLGGSGEIGMNANFYHYKGKWLLVDLGITFTDLPGIEILMPDLQGFLPYVKNLVGIVLTHGHEDHYGALLYLWNQLKCPVYATPFTAELLRKKIKSSSLNIPIHEVNLGGSVSIGPFSVEFISLTHSIPEPNALAIRTDAGTILHTGDWKLDANPVIKASANKEALKRLGKEGVLSLNCDSTNVFEEGHSGSELEVKKELISLVGKYPEGKVVIACFASNVARVLSCVEAAQKNKRKAALAGLSLKRFAEVSYKCKYFNKTVKFLPEEEAKKIDPSKLLLIATGSQGEPRAALSSIAKGAHPTVKLQSGDTIIFSSRIIPGNEKAVYELQNQFVRMGVRLITHREADKIHVSGHPFREELKEMYQWIRPQIAIPLHGESRHLYEHRDFALSLGVPQAIAPYNGDILQLSPGPAKKIGKLPSGRIALDGTRLIPANGGIIKERFQLMRRGCVFITLTISCAVKKPLEFSVFFHGLFENEQQKNLQATHIKKILKNSLYSKLNPNNTNLIRDEIKLIVGQFFNQEIGKKPIIHSEIIWI